MPMTPRLREACGGARFLDLAGLALAVPFVLVTAVATSATPDLRSWTLWLLVNLGAVAATVPVILTVRAVHRQNGVHPWPLATTTLLGALIGLTKGLATTALALAAGLVDTPWPDALGRGLNTAVIGALLIPALAALLSARDRWAEERSLLMVELTRRALDDPGRTATEHRHALHHATQGLRDELVALAPQDWPDAIRTNVARELKPLSAEILAASQAPPVSGGWTLLRTALQREPLSIGVITTLYAATSALLLLRHVPATDAALLGLLLAAATAGLLSITQTLRVRRPAAWPLWLGSCLVALMAVQDRLSTRVLGVVESLDNPGITVISALWFSEILVATTVITSARRERSVIHERLLHLLGPHGVQQAVGHGVRALEGREFAFFIHGHLQNRLLALADRLERHDRAATTPGPHAPSTQAREIERVAREIMDTLDASSPPVPEPRPLLERLDDIVDRWQGVAEIHLTTTENLDGLDASLTEQIDHVVVEAVTNAVRHGAARQIWVHLARKGDSVTLTVDDDGFGPRRGRPGTGSHYFDLVAPADWTLTGRPEGGARLAVRLGPRAQR